MAAAAATAQSASRSAPLLLTQPLDSYVSDTAAVPLPAVPVANNSHNHDHINTSPDSPCLSITPPPFVAPNMLDSPVPFPASLTVLPWPEQQPLREQLICAPGLLARWRMHRIVAIYSDNALNTFSQQLLGDRVSSFELVLTYAGLHMQKISCLYTIAGANAVFCESPLHAPHVRFSEDGQVLNLIQGARAWNAMHRDFELKFIPSLLLACSTTQSVRQ